MVQANLNAAVAWTQQSVNNALNGRVHLGSLFQSAPGTTGLTAWRDGVGCTSNQGGSNNIPNDLQIKAVSPTPSMSLTCEAGHCVITRTGQGPYLCYLLTQGTLTLADASTLNPRKDIVIAQLYDTAIGDSVAGLTPSLSAPGGLVIRSVTGTPAGSPVAPSVPAGAILLAEIAVAQNATSITNANITDKRRAAYTVGGARTQLPGDLLVTDNGAVSGELKYVVADAHAGLYVWSGSVWKPAGIPVYTSTGARDAALTAPFTDQLAYTSDQHKLWRYTGSGWVLALGEYNKVTPAADYSLSTTDTMRDTLTFNAVVGHEYELRYSGCFSLNTTGNVVFNMRIVAGASVTTAAATIAGPRYVLGSSGIGDFDFAFSWTGVSTAQYTFGVSAATGPGVTSGTVYGTTSGPGRQLRFRDYG